MHSPMSQQNTTINPTLDAVSSVLADEPRFLRALRGLPVDRPPVWLMRQAGRYLPEYRAIRSQTSFLGLCKNPDLAAEVTLQPIRRFGFDASIVFSDILIVPEAMGMQLSFGAGEGPKLEPPVRSMDDVKKLAHFDPLDKTKFVVDTVARIVDQLPKNVPLIGFAGAPFTVACYMVEGEGSKNFLHVKRLMHGDRNAFALLLDRLVVNTIDYLRAQVDAGCRALQLFDTWAGELDPEDFLQCAVEPAQRIVAAIKQSHPHIPVIYFPRGGADMLDIASSVGADAYGLDWRARIPRARAVLGSQITLQGNLDPACLFAPVETVVRKTRLMLESNGGNPRYICNLGHGILPETPISAVEAMLDTVFQYKYPESSSTPSSQTGTP